jgi:hypothetical protein
VGGENVEHLQSVRGFEQSRSHHRPSNQAMLIWGIGDVVDLLLLMPARNDAYLLDTMNRRR